MLIFDKVSAKKMPPSDYAQLEPRAIKEFSRELSSALVTAEEKMLGGEGRTTRRRMNRYEYENALCAIFGIPVLEVRDFLPEDRVADGFNKVGDALDVSHVQLSRYLAASESALRQAMAPQVKRPKAMLRRYYAWDMPGFYKSAGPTIRQTFYIDDMQIHAAPAHAAEVRSIAGRRLTRP